MALIYCPECGNTVSDKANACPHCGYPLPIEPEIEHKTASFCLCREQRAFFFAVKYEVYLDNMFWGILANGDRLTTELVLGKHHLELVDKNNFNKVVYDTDFIIDDNLTFTFSAAMNINMKSSSPQSFLSPESNSSSRAIPVNSAPSARTAKSNTSSSSRRCPKCGGTMTIQTVSEARKTGCGTVLLYILLFVTILGWLILIPLMLRKRTETATYAVCQNCGYKKRVS